jgi:hypothetical protein
VFRIRLVGHAGLPWTNAIGRAGNDLTGSRCLYREGLNWREYEAVLDRQYSFVILLQVN